MYYNTLIKLAKAACVLKFAFFRVFLPQSSVFLPLITTLLDTYSFNKVHPGKSQQISTKQASIPKGYEVIHPWERKCPKKST